MGMVANMLRVSTKELEEYKKNSSLLEKRIYSEESIEDDCLLDLDKSLEALFYMVTGKGIGDTEKMDSPFVGLVFSKNSIDEKQDFGYGPATYITSEEVKVLNTALQNVSVEEFQKNYQVKKMNALKIYPGTWKNKQDDIDYVVVYFMLLKTFYEKAAKEGNAVINIIN